MNENQHTFNFDLPLIPHQRIQDSSPFDLRLEMDGRPLKGVTGLHVRAGANGFTNVELEFEAATALQFVAELTADPGLPHTEELDLQLAKLYRRAQAAIEYSQEQGSAEDENSYTRQAALVRKLVALLIENVK